MNTVSAHAATLTKKFPGFSTGMSVVCRPSAKKRVVIFSVFNRAIANDPGLRLQVLLPVSEVEYTDRRVVNLLGDAVEDMIQMQEIVVTRQDFPTPFTIMDVCNGIVFGKGTVLRSRECGIPRGALPENMVGVYVSTYCVFEIRIMYHASDDIGSVYDKHPPIFENICGSVPTATAITHAGVVCVHGNITFKASNAIFKGVRDVSKIEEVIQQLLTTSDHSVVLKARVNMAVVTACLGKSSLVGTSGSLLENSLLFTQGAQTIGLVAKTENEKNMVKIKILDWTLLLNESARKGYSSTNSSLAMPERLLSNYCIVSNNGFVIIRFHWNNVVWDRALQDDVMLASTILTECIWHNC